MKILKEVILILLIFVFSIPTHSQTDYPQTEKRQELEEILKNCAEYCQRLENITLYFVCEENITEVINTRYLSRVAPTRTTLGSKLKQEEDSSPWSDRKTFVYDYQLNRKGSFIDEQRILLKENGKKKNVGNARLQTKRFQHKYVVYGPIGLLGRKQQEKFDYSILKEVLYKGSKAVIIEATPKFPDEFDALYGKIWVGKEDSCILKIEWNPISMTNYEEIEKIAQQSHASPKLQFVSEYGFEKNKIRFPNRYCVEEIYIFPRGQRFNRSKTTVLYDKYKFFIVETAVKY